MLLGCIADDFTGATDLAGTIANAGLTAVQVNGVPETGLRIDPADAVVVALKSRTIEAASAVAQSLAALAWLRSQGAQRFYFKVCSTFDSTPAGNIGPVADALCEALGARLNVVTPAYPRNARTVYQGHLFVGESLLSDTGMRTHPLTPMTDSNLVRVLAAQTPRRVGLLPHAVTARGPGVILAGSCSAATLAQIERVKDALPRLRLDPVALHRDRGAAAAALDWARARLGERPLLIYASAPPEQVAAAQAALGREQAAQVVEDALRTIAVGLAAAGARRFVVAGGETSGAVVEALGVRALAIGPEIAPGVPWTRAADGKPYALALKSGNFGGPDFFTRAFELAP